MAIWQTHINLVSTSGTIDFDKLITSSLVKQFPETESWSNDNHCFGCIDKTCIEIFVLEAVVDEISVKIDVSNISKEELECIVKFAVENDLQILFKNQYYNLSVDNIVKIIRLSDAFWFVKNPREFLDSLGN